MCDLCITLLAVDKNADHQILLGLLRTRPLAFYRIRCCFCGTLLSDLLYFIVIKHKWSQHWNLRKIVLSQDVFVFDLVNKCGFISLKRKENQILLNVTDVFCQVNSLSCLSAFARQFLQPRIHFSPVGPSSFRAQFLFCFPLFNLQAFPDSPSDCWVQMNPSFLCTCKCFYVF